MGGFLKRLLPFAALIAMILIILSFMDGFDMVMSFAWVCFGVFLAFSILTYYFSTKTITGKFGAFMNIFFVSIFSKLIVTAVIVLIFKSKHKTADINFIIPFAIIYFSFLFFETIELVKLSKKTGNSNKQKKDAAPPI